MATRSLEEFMADMEPFGGLFDSSKDIERYYRACAARMPKLAAIHVRTAIRFIGYHIVTPTVNGPECDDVRSHLTTDEAALLDWEELCRMIPPDFVVSFHDNFYNTQLVGNFMLDDLLYIDSVGELQIRLRNEILRDIIVGFVAPSPRNYLGNSSYADELHKEFMKLRGSKDITDLYRALLIREVMRSSLMNLPEHIRAYHASHGHEEIDRWLKTYLTLYRVIVVDESLISEHVIGKIADEKHLTWLFDKLGVGELQTGGYAEFLKRFIAAFRLDGDFPPYKGLIQGTSIQS